MMSWIDFYNKIKDLESERSKAIWIAPTLGHMPLPIQRYDEPFFPFSKAIIQATQPYAGIYIFDFAHYLATGASGIVALERAIAYVRDTSICILNGPFSGESYTKLADDISLAIDGLTVTLSSDLDFYITNPPYSAFLWNPQVSVTHGGSINHNQLSLHAKDLPSITIPIYHTADLLTDLSDRFSQTIIEHLR